MLLAMRAGAVAMPEALVVTVAVSDAPGNVPLGPELGAVNVTIAAGTGLLPESVTSTERAFANAVLMGALWGLPPAITMAAGSPTMLVSPRLAGPKPKTEKPR